VRRIGEQRREGRRTAILSQTTTERDGKFGDLLAGCSPISRTGSPAGVALAVAINRQRQLSLGKRYGRRSVQHFHRNERMAADFPASLPTLPLVLHAGAGERPADPSELTIARTQRGT